MKYKIIIAYDGSAYVGWQLQPKGVSIQGVVEATLFSLFQEKVRVVGASRTDSGVHALCQVAHFEALKNWPPEKLLIGLNALLPCDIRVKEVSLVEPDFHAQHHALRKTYHYHLFRRVENDPFQRRYHYHFYAPLDLPLMRQATQLFLGTHDFTTFTNKGSHTKSPIRTIYRFDIIEEGDYFRFEIEGNGFLYKMVRNCVSALLEVGQGRLSLEALTHLFTAHDRRLAPAPVPPEGLFLTSIEYKESAESRGK